MNTVLHDKITKEIINTNKEEVRNKNRYFKILISKF